MRLVIEQASGYTFSVPDAFKGGGGADVVAGAQAGNWKLRSDSCGADDAPEGWRPTLSVSERTAACQAE